MTEPFELCCLQHTFSSGAGPVCTSPGQITHSSGSSYILGSPVQTRLHFYRYDLPGTPGRDAPATHVASADLWNRGWGFHNPFPHVSFVTLKPALCRWHSQVWCHLGMVPGPLSHICSCLLFHFRTRKSWKVNWLGSCLRESFSVFHHRSGLPLIFLSLYKPWPQQCPFSLNCTFYISFHLICSAFFQTCTEGITYNHVTE